MNCKPGDLAVIVDAPKGSDALGAFVEVLWASDYAPDYASPEGKRHNCSPRWWVRAQRPLEVRLGRQPARFNEFNAPDSALRPIRPDGITTDEVKELYEPAPPFPMQPLKEKA